MPLPIIDRCACENDGTQGAAPKRVPIGTKVRLMRMARGWSLRKLAEAVEPPIHFTMLGKLERGDVAMTEDYAVRLYEALGHPSPAPFEEDAGKLESFRRLPSTRFDGPIKFANPAATNIGDFGSSIGSRLMSLKARCGLSLPKIAEGGGWAYASSIQRYFAESFDPPFLPLPVMRRLDAAFSALGFDVSNDLLEMTGVDRLGAGKSASGDWINLAPLSPADRLALLTIYNSLVSTAAEAGRAA